MNDYTLVNIVSPLDGEVIPAYNLLRAKQGVNTNRVDFNTNDADLRRRTYNGVELGASARFKGGSLFGGWTFDRLVTVTCDSKDDPNTFRFCDQSQLGLPLRHEFKASGTYLLPWWGIQTNLAFQSYSGPVLPTRWNISRTTTYAADCKAPCTPGAVVIPNLTPTSLIIELVAPGQSYYERLNQVDIGLRKIFRVGKYQFSGQADIFNVTNSSYVKSQNTTWGSSLGQPTDVLQPRMLRLAAQIKF